MARRILHCAACVRRTVHPSLVLHTALPIRAAPIPSRRRYATTAADDRATTDNTNNADVPRTLDAPELTPEQIEARRKQRFNTVVSKELKHLSEDPWNVQAWVERALKRDFFDEALAIVQKRSYKETQLTVAWNHLIDYCLKNQQLRKALKVFNDVSSMLKLEEARLTPCR